MPTTSFPHYFLPTHPSTFTASSSGICRTGMAALILAVAVDIIGPHKTIIVKRKKGLDRSERVVKAENEEDEDRWGRRGKKRRREEE